MKSFDPNELEVIGWKAEVLISKTFFFERDGSEKFEHIEEYDRAIFDDRVQKFFDSLTTNELLTVREGSVLESAGARIIGTQPMDAPSGLIFKMTRRY